MNMLESDSRSLRIFSGGQTGVDRAALDVAIEFGLEHGGWCPRGRQAEDGSIPSRYQLRETADAEYATRTRLNVEDSDGTLVLNRGELNGGTKLTIQFAEQAHKPLLVVDPDQPMTAVTFKRWLAQHRIGTLNIAGPRESKQPGIYAQAVALLRTLLPART